MSKRKKPLRPTARRQKAEGAQKCKFIKFLDIFCNFFYKYKRGLIFFLFYLQFKKKCFEYLQKIQKFSQLFQLFSKIEVVDRIVNLVAGINRNAFVQVDFCSSQKSVNADKSGLNTLAVDSR